MPFSFGLSVVVLAFASGQGSSGYLNFFSILYVLPMLILARHICVPHDQLTSSKALAVVEPDYMPESNPDGARKSYVSAHIEYL
jgi:hypothetical protein